MKHLISALVLSALFGCSDSEEYCNSLVETASSAHAQAMMRSWVSNNIHERQYTGDESDVIGAGGMWPGFFFVLDDVDWTVLNIGGEVVLPQIRLVSLPDDVSSVFFGERSGYGFLVRTEGSRDFGIDEKHIFWRSNDIAVTCRPRD